MSVSAPSDIQQPAGGFGGQVNPSIPDQQSSGFPTDGTGVAAEGMYDPNASTNEFEEPYVLNEDDINFLQSNEVREWLGSNVPQGFMTEAQHRERLAKAQSTTDSELNTVRSELSSMQEQRSELRSQMGLLVRALRQSWEDAGYTPGSEEYQQREAAVLQAIQTTTNAEKVQRQEQAQQRATLAAQNAASINQMLNLYGISPVGNPELIGAIRNHFDAVRTGRLSDPAQIEASRMAVVSNAVQQFRPQPVQQQAPAQASPQQALQQQPQPQQRQRQNFGPGPGPRGGGGGAPPSYEDAYAEEQQRLVQQYGSWAKVPQPEIYAMDLRAQGRSLGLPPDAFLP